MKLFFLYILSISLSGSIFGQENLDPKFFIGKEINRKLGEILTNHEIGSGISLVYFKQNVDLNQKKVTIFSSNSKTKLILDSFFKMDTNMLFSKNATSSFILPIIQIMYDDQTQKNKNYLNWDNNTFEQMSDFKNLKKISSTVLFINPLIIYGLPPIIN